MLEILSITSTILNLVVEALAFYESCKPMPKMAIKTSDIA
ncbi:hypothetical protein HMPREF9391_2158 [Streptococcus sanguinis SK408]|uniref:Uncharacterized protein n=1 Tax=Streptococcus sanguinis SK408 TaxID=888818 RepID=F2CH92_STRSA|nr:hypothetical protein HMPREF9391_2158 [Streptococcus sanguinis SK408]